MVLVPTCLDFVIWGGINALMVLPLESCHHQCPSAVCGVLGYPEASATELLDGSLKLWYCTTVFTTQMLHLWFHLGWVEELVRVVTSGNLLDCRGGKRVRLTRKTRPGGLSLVYPDPGRSTPRRWKRLRLPSSEGVGGEVGVPRNLSPRLGVG